MNTAQRGGGRGREGKRAGGKAHHEGRGRDTRPSPAATAQRAQRRRGAGSQGARHLISGQISTVKTRKSGDAAGLERSQQKPRRQKRRKRAMHAEATSSGKRPALRRAWKRSRGYGTTAAPEVRKLTGLTGVQERARPGRERSPQAPRL